MATNNKTKSNTQNNKQKQDLNNAGIKRGRTEKQEYWSLLKEAFGQIPQNVNAQFVMATEYYRNELRNIVKGRIKIECEEWWSKDFMLDLLICKGRFFVTKHRGNVYPLDGSPHGINVFGRPPYITITNPILPTFERTLYGKDADCVAVYVYDDMYYRPIEPMIDRYAEKLASIDGSLDVNLLNTRTPFIFNVKDNKQAQEAKLFYDKVSRGEPAIFASTKNPMDTDGSVDISVLPVKDNYITDKLLEAKRGVIGEFLNRVGLNTTPYEKRERLIADEVNSNNAEICANVDYMKRNFEQQSKKVRDMFGIKFNVELVEGGCGSNDKIRQDVHKTADSDNDNSRNN